MPAAPRDCGNTDVCAARYCDMANDSCAADIIDYNMSYSFTGQISGDVVLACGLTVTVETLQLACATGAMFDLLLQCQLDSDGQLSALGTSTNTACMASIQGVPVTSDCSVAAAGAGGASLSCCWP